MQSGNSSKKISKIRTFQDDISSVRPNANQSNTVGKEVIKETTFSAKKPYEQTIFKPATPNTPAVVNPQLSQEKNIKPPTPPTVLTLETPKKPIIPILPKQSPIDSTNKQLSEAIPQETLSSIADTSVSQVISDDTSSEGSVITDQKRTRFSLTSSIVEAIKAWFTNEKESFKDRAETKRKAIPTVRPVEKRKEVLQKAAQQSAMAPKDDHQQLATKIAALPKATVQQNDKPVQIKEKTAPTKPSWSHFTDGQKKQDSEETTLPTTDTPPKTPEPVKTVLAPAPVKQNPTGLMPALTTPEVFKSKVAKPTTTVNPAPNSIEEVKPKPPEIKLVGDKKKTSFVGLRKFLTYSGIAAVIVIAITSGAGLVWWFFSNSSQTPAANLAKEEAQPVQQDLVTHGQNISTTLPLRKEELWQNILSKKESSGSGLVLILLMSNDNTPATTSEILEKINWPSNSAFLKNIEEVNFGLYRGTPFMVMKTTNFDTVFGGLLSSEPTLPEDLDLFISSSTETLATSFTDELIQNHDVRVLKNESGSDVLVYGFVNRNTIIITSNRETFSEVATQVR